MTKSVMLVSTALMDAKPAHGLTFKFRFVGRLDSREGTKNLKKYPAKFTIDTSVAPNNLGRYAKIISQKLVGAVLSDETPGSSTVPGDWEFAA